MILKRDFLTIVYKYGFQEKHVPHVNYGGGGQF